MFLRFWTVEPVCWVALCELGVCRALGSLLSMCTALLVPRAFLPCALRVLYSPDYAKVFRALWPSHLLGFALSLCLVYYYPSCYPPRLPSMKLNNSLWVFLTNALQETAFSPEEILSWNTLRQACRWGFWKAIGVGCLFQAQRQLEKEWWQQGEMCAVKLTIFSESLSFHQVNHCWMGGSLWLISRDLEGFNLVVFVISSWFL